MSTQKSGYEGFSKLRGLFWPIYGYELKKLLPLLLIFFLLAFNYNVLRCLKDSLVVTADKSGVEIIAFIKVWVMFPSSILLTYIFLKLSNRFPREKVFYIMLLIFLSFFFLFAFFIYPARDYLHPTTSADTLQSWLPDGMRGFVAMYRYWSFTIFYTMSELWGPIVMSVLCWGFANQVTKIDEAKRFYPLFGIGVNVAAIGAGMTSWVISDHMRKAAISAGWERAIVILVTLVIISGVGAMGLFRFLNKVSLKDPRLACDKEPPRAEKKKFSLRENIKFLATSKYVLSLAAMITCYNIVINLVEMLWKEEVNELVQKEALAYNMFMNSMTVITGILATFVAFFVSGNLIRKYGWTFTAMVSPILLLITSVGFFGFFFLKGHAEALTAFLGVTPLFMVVLFGSLQNCCSRVVRYTVFDATREMAYVPLPTEQKIKAKAAIDGVCNRLGKSGGAVTYQVLLIFLSTIPATAPYVAVAILAIIGVWIGAVHILGKEFHDLTQTTAETPAVVTKTGQPVQA